MALQVAKSFTWERKSSEKLDGHITLRCPRLWTGGKETSKELEAVLEEKVSMAGDLRGC